MGAINAEWHKVHRMPKNPSQEQRLMWHAEHLKHCTCRAPSDKLLKELEKKKLIP